MENATSSAEALLLQRFEEWMKENASGFTEDLIHLISFRSVSQNGEGGYPFGTGCARCLDAALEIGKKFGLKTENHEYYCGSVILEGKQKEEIGIVGHLDIVSEGNGWTYSPYEAVEKEGYVIGRGSADNKGAVMMALYSLKFLHDMGIRPRYTIRVLMGCNEESGMEDVKYYAKNYEAPMLSLCCDTGFPFHYGEKGRYVAKLRAGIDRSEIEEISGGTSVGSVADKASAVLKGQAAQKAEKASLPEGVERTSGENGTVTITAHGRAGHTAFPEGTVNAIQKLAQALTEAELVTGKNKTTLLFLERAFRDYYGEGLNIAVEDEHSGKLTHAGGLLVREGDEVVQSLNVRYPITLPNADEIKRHVHEVCDQYGVAVEKEDDDPPFYIERGLPVLRLLDRTCREFMDVGDDEPFVMRGGTHCRRFPRLVGYGPFLQDTPERQAKKRFGGAHGPDEAVNLQGLYDAIRTYAVTLVRLSELPESGFCLNPDSLKS